MKWKVRLTGRARTLEELSKTFDSDPKIFEDNGSYFLWSSRFSEKESSIEVEEVSSEIIKKIRNLNPVLNLNIEDISTYYVVEMESNGTESTHVNLQFDAVDADSSTVSLSVDGEEPPPLSEDIYEYFALAKEDELVDELLDIRNNGKSWVNLYRLYEFIRDNINDNENMIEKGWITNTEKNRFTHTANSFEAIGNDARHATNKHGEPDDPMTHSEAISTIDKLIGNWLDYRKNMV